jgi:hypothetical protein
MLYKCYTSFTWGYGIIQVSRLYTLQETAATLLINNDKYLGELPLLLILINFYLK